MGTPLPPSKSDNDLTKQLKGYNIGILQYPPKKNKITNSCYSAITRCT